MNATIDNVTLPPNLKVLKLTFFNARGRLPVFPETLEILNIDYNRFRGPLVLPSQIKSIDIAYNQFNGSIPLLPASIEHFGAFDNIFSGPIPQLSHTSLKSFEISSN